MYTLLLTVCLLVIGFPSVAAADGCYLCEGGGYVEYVGKDTFAKRKKAKQQFGCVVSGTTSTCSNPKGMVATKSDLKRDTD